MLLSRHSVAKISSAVVFSGQMSSARMMLSQAMRTKAAYDKAVAGVWGGVGLPTKRDQERSLYLLNKLESRIYDLEKKLEELKAKDAR